MYPNVTSTEIDILSAVYGLSTQHPDYARLAARLVTQNHKATPEPPGQIHTKMVLALPESC
jgi:hypothetical protein